MDWTVLTLAAVGALAALVALGLGLWLIWQAWRDRRAHRRIMRRVEVAAADLQTCRELWQLPVHTDALAPPAWLNEQPHRGLEW